DYPRLFEARLMKKRHELGLPLIQIDQLEDLPNDVRRTYEEGFIQAAREVGNLFLADGNVQRAWPYFRAIGETAPIAAAIEQIESQEEIAPIIEIAFHEGVHPRKGFELILSNYGICRAITSFHQYPGRNGREECLRLLIRRVHGDLVENLQRTISRNEGQAPETRSIPELIAGRDWLFEGNSYYLDTSHVVSVIQFSLELNDRETLALGLELTEYGSHLSSLFQYRGDPPFQNVYLDHGIYLRALLGEGVEEAIRHFRNKLTEGDPSARGSEPAQVLVRLLARLERYAEAIEVSLEHLHPLDPTQLACPSVLQLCQLAGDYTQLMKLAREQGDLLSFAAGVLQT
ncbi:MAG: hypothetical protein DMG05_27455, partial [Acidobacteria bacterium]